MVRLRKSLRVVLAALLLMGALAGGSPSVSAAPPRPNPPTVPGNPRNGDPDMPDWNNRVGNKSTDVLPSRTIWDFLRAMLARDEA